MENTLTITVSNNSMFELLSELSKVSFNPLTDGLLIDTSGYNSARPHILAVLTSFMKKNDDFYETIWTTLPSDEDVKKYMTRMNFYELNRFNVPYPYRKYDSTGRFLEVTGFTESTSDSIIDKLTNIFANPQLGLPVGMQRALAFCFSEMVDNCCCHSLSKFNNHICAQVFYDRVEICIVDNGIGIPKSLSEVSEYSSFNNEELLAKSIIEKVTSKRHSKERSHQGFGLFAVNEILKMNGGSLEIYTDNVALITKGGKTDIVSIPTWEGTIVYMCLKKTHNVFEWQNIWNAVFESRGFDKPVLSHADVEDDFF